MSAILGEKLCLISDKVTRGVIKEAILDPDGILRIAGQFCVPMLGDLIRLIVEDAYCTRYSIHPRMEKMYHDLTQNYWWRGIKKDISNFASKCMNCQQVKC